MASKKRGRVVTIKGKKGAQFRYHNGRHFAKSPKRKPKYLNVDDWNLLKKKTKPKPIKTKNVKAPKTGSQNFRNKYYPETPKQRQEFLSTSLRWYIKLERAKIVDSDDDVQIASGGLSLSGFYSKRTIISRSNYDREIRRMYNVLMTQEGWFLSEDMATYLVVNKTRKRNGRHAVVDADSWQPIQDLV